MFFSTHARALLSTLVLGLLPMAQAAQANDPDFLAERYQAELAACSRHPIGSSQRLACEKEAHAALQVARDNPQNLSQPSDAQQRANALRRCNSLPPEQRATCVKMRTSQDVKTQGSIEGGGVLRTMTIRETGSPVPAPLPIPENYPTQATPVLR